ncbi:MAG TPA: EamA family transporter, partial [Thermodesulfobacteriota bacterium]|nr:EamA family transporter [Thermodesulfobacteriota bacterium]
MPPAAVGLVVAAALVHASWNLLVKQAKDPSAFVVLAVAACALLGLPAAAWGAAAGLVPPAAWGIAWTSGAVKALYFSLLAAGYRRAELSLLYPTARGSSPLLVALASGPLLGERVTPLGAAAIGTVVAGIAGVAAGS